MHKNKKVFCAIYTPVGVERLLSIKYRLIPPVKTSGLIWDSQEEPRELWRDRAGGYGIQDLFGMLFVEGIEGDFYNVMGLPIGRVYEELKKLGVIK